MFKWFWNWLDSLDGNVDGAVFGLGKAVQKLDKAIEANKRIADAANEQALAHQSKANKAKVKQAITLQEASRAARIKGKVEELLQ